MLSVRIFSFMEVCAPVMIPSTIFLVEHIQIITPRLLLPTVLQRSLFCIPVYKAKALFPVRTREKKGGQDPESEHLLFLSDYETDFLPVHLVYIPSSSIARSIFLRVSADTYPLSLITRHSTDSYPALRHIFNFRHSYLTFHTASYRSQ